MLIKAKELSAGQDYHYFSNLSSPIYHKGYMIHTVKHSPALPFSGKVLSKFQAALISGLTLTPFLPGGPKT